MLITNTNSQLKIVHSTNNEYYKYETFKSISWALDAKGYYVLINFIANDKNNSLRLYMVDITNQGTWTNTAAGAANAVNDIASWAGTASSTVVITPTVKYPTVIRSTGASLTMVGANVNSISFASVGTANATVQVSGNSVILKPGETVSYDAGDINNYMPGGVFYYDTSLSGSELLIIYVQ
jgi:hypothetical protein